jgi:hypothetical protein
MILTKLHEQKNLKIHFESNEENKRKPICSHFTEHH